MSQKIDDKYRFYHVKKTEIRIFFLKSIKLLIKLNNKEIVKKANSQKQIKYKPKKENY